MQHDSSGTVAGSLTGIARRRPPTVGGAAGAPGLHRPFCVRWSLDV